MVVARGILDARMRAHGVDEVARAGREADVGVRRRTSRFFVPTARLKPGRRVKRQDLESQRSIGARMNLKEMADRVAAENHVGGSELLGIKIERSDEHDGEFVFGYFQGEPTPEEAAREGFRVLLGEAERP